MLILYDKAHVKVDGLTNYKELKLDREINVEDVLSFSYPLSDDKTIFIQEECYIRTKDNEYVVKEVNFNEDDWVEYVCKVNVETIKGESVSNFETIAQTCTAAVNLLLSGTGWSIGSCDVTKLRTVRKNNCSGYDVLQEVQSIYGCEMSFDAIHKLIYIYQVMGSDRGSYFAEQLNLKSLTVQRNSYSYITRLIPIGKDGLNITSVNGGLDYVYNIQYSGKDLAAFWEDNRYTVAQDLMDDAIDRLAYLSLPFKSYSADIFDLASINSDYSILDYSLGDMITLLAKSKNTKEKQRIVKLTQYLDEPERNTCEIANRMADLASLQVRLVDTADVVDTVTTSDGLVDGTKIDAVDWGVIQHVSIVLANIQDLNAVTARIGTLEVTTAHITNGIIDNATIDIAKVNNLSATYATITNLTAANGNISNLTSNVASINTLLAGNIGAANLAAGAIQAGSAVIANGAIGSAQIDTLDVSKLNSGNISTNKFTVQSDSGNLKIQGNTIKAWDTAGKERVSLGLNGTDYNLLIRGIDGTTVLFGTDGVTHAGITAGAVDDTNVAVNANINGAKLDINSVVSSINGATTLLKSSHIIYDPTGQTFEVAFGALKTTVTDQGTIVSNQTTSISVLQGQITTKVSQADVNASIDALQIGGRNLVLNSKIDITSNVYGFGTRYLNLIAGTTYTFSMNGRIDAQAVTDGKWLSCILYKTDWSWATALTIGSITNSTSIATFVSPISGLVYISFYMMNGDSNRLGTVTVNWVKVEIGNKATDWTPAPEDTQALIDGATTRITTAETTIIQNTNAIALKASQTSLDTTNGRMTTAEASIVTNANGITLKADKTYVDAIQIGGRNILANSRMDHLIFNCWTPTVYELVTDATHGQVFHVQAGGGYYPGLTSPLAVGEVVTVSFYAKALVASTMATGFNNGAWVTPFTNANIGTAWGVYSFNTVVANAGEVGTYFYIYPGATEFWIKTIKIERGNKATDWSPAPEDSPTNNNIISTINLSSEGITINAAKIGISGSTIDISSNSSITLKADKTYVDGIEIGGRNLIPGSDFETDLTGFIKYSTSNTTVSWSTDYAYQGTHSLKLVSNSLQLTGITRAVTPVMNYLGRNMVVSFMIRGIGSSIGRNITARIIEDGATITQSGVCILSATWKKVQVTKLIAASTTTIDIQLFGIMYSTEIMYVDCVKFEIGSKATDWTPAPEDSPSNTNIISTINLSTESISISAAKLNLTGYITATNLATSGQTTINGGNITTGYLSADRISGGTITGVTVNVTTNIHVGDNVYMGNQVTGGNSKYIFFNSECYILGGSGAYGGVMTIKAEGISFINPCAYIQFGSYLANIYTSSNIHWSMNGAQLNIDKIVIGTCVLTLSGTSYLLYRDANGFIKG